MYICCPWHTVSDVTLNRLASDGPTGKVCDLLKFLRVFRPNLGMQPSLKRKCMSGITVFQRDEKGWQMNHMIFVLEPPSWKRTCVVREFLKGDRRRRLTLEEIAGSAGINHCCSGESCVVLCCKHFGNDWKDDEDLAWYNALLLSQPINNMEDDTAEPCDCLAEENTVHV
ncbi:hypothetical protein NQ318_011298 [Aromia moschata]|uniref:Uncharacterized protein n=1 Tax=Aromia moschata TaxID=1265417 RepID=A0AAV8XV86_9CUCU|nr:hypothetical protein NQ318_011298 [Aromia moschata]